MLEQTPRSSKHKLQELEPTTLQQINRYRFDHILEKHEGPARWDWLIESDLVEFRIKSP
jgi:hypothetical protein